MIWTRDVTLISSALEEVFQKHLECPYLEIKSQWHDWTSIVFEMLFGFSFLNRKEEVRLLNPVVAVRSAIVDFHILGIQFLMCDEMESPVTYGNCNDGLGKWERIYPVPQCNIYL